MGHDSTVLASSRTLRAGFADAEDGILDKACARRFGESLVGTERWPSRSNQEMTWLVQAASFWTVARVGLNFVCVLSIAHATASSRSPTVRNARPCECPRLRNSP